jgi:hypothetical protein
MASMVMASMKKKHKNPKPPKYMTLSQKYLRFALFGLLAINPLEAQASDTSSPTYLQQMYEWITKDPNKEPVNKETNADSRDTNKDTSNDIKNGTKVVETKASDNTASSAFYGINNHGKSLTTPVAWGASNNVIYMGVGGTIPAPYRNESDAAAEVGIGLGDTQKNLGVQLSLVSLDMSQWDRYSLYLHLSKDIDNASAIGAGIENIMLSAGGDAEKSFYVVYSHGIKRVVILNSITVSVPVRAVLAIKALMTFFQVKALMAPMFLEMLLMKSLVHSMSLPSGTDSTSMQGYRRLFG